MPAGTDATYASEVWGKGMGDVIWRLQNPYGSKDPNNRDLGPKYYNIHDIWEDPIIWVLGPLGKIRGVPFEGRYRGSIGVYRVWGVGVLKIRGPFK